MLMFAGFVAFFVLISSPILPQPAPPCKNYFNFFWWQSASRWGTLGGMKKPSPKTARINVRVPPVLHDRLVRYGREEGIGELSDTCRQILSQAMTSVYGRPIGSPEKPENRRSTSYLNETP